MLELSRADLDVGMVANDTAAMLHFYGDIIGLPRAGQIKLPGRGTIHKFVVGTCLVKVFEAEASLPKSDPTKYPWDRTGLQYWSVHVVALDPVVARLAEHALAPVSGIIDTGIGIRYMMVHDPDGNVVEFIEGDGANAPAASDKP
jgi:catechol 2,3-dioxygenase-like lactoylglutathione lyase family enzyme